MLKRLLFGLLLSPLAPLALAAAETRVALVIGNSAYVHTQALPNPRNDGQAIAAKLRGLGFQVLDGYDLDFVATRALLRRFADASAGADVALLYYAGHAIQVDGQNYLLPVDSRLRTEADLRHETYAVDLVLQDLGQARKLRLAILDACRDNPLAQTMARSMGTRSTAVGRGLARVDAPARDTVIAYATRAGATADDGQTNHSPYAAALLEHIGTPGLDVTRMFGRTRDAVLVATGNRQEPYIYGSLGGETWSFAPKAPEPVPAPIQAPTPEAQVYWDLIATGEDPQVFRNFLSRFSDPALAAKARERIAALEAKRPTAAPSPPPPVADLVPTPASPEDSALKRASEIPPRFIQLALKDLGRYQGPADGKLGTTSQKAIRAWQGARGLAQTGRLDNRQTVDLLVQAAQAGKPQSQNILGMMTAAGIGLPQDPAAARAWFEKSAAQGNEYAAFNLGVLYRDGNGVTASPAKAREWFQQAKRSGHPDAAKALAALN